MDFLEKLDFLMERFDLTKTSLSQKSGIPYTTIDAWYKKGYEGLKLTTLRKLASYFNTTLDYWFLDEITDPNYGKSSGFKVEYTEMEHIKKYRSLDPQGQTIVDTVLDLEVTRSAQLLDSQKRITELEGKIVLDHAPSRLLSYYGRIAAAGKSYGFEDMICGTIQVPLTDDNQSADYTIGVSGDSMEPDFTGEDIVYVRKATHLNLGDIGIFQKDNCIYIKKVGDGVLLSINPEYDPIPGEDVKVLGKVIGKIEEDYKIIK